MREKNENFFSVAVSLSLLRQYTLMDSYNSIREWGKQHVFGMTCKYCLVFSEVLFQLT
jgi:hypothetical protein